MPMLLWTVPLRETDIIVNRLTTDRGRVTAFLVQYVAEINSEWHPIVRFDTAHGVAHRDILNWDGQTIRKDMNWEGSQLSLGEAFNLAQEYIKENWEGELATFLRRRPTR